jgi:hypothetical protein
MQVAGAFCPPTKPAWPGRLRLNAAADPDAGRSPLTDLRDGLGGRWTQGPPGNGTQAFAALQAALTRPRAAVVNSFAAGQRAALPP